MHRRFCFLQVAKFGIRSVGLTKLDQLVEPGQRVGSGRVDDFRMALRAKVKRLAVRLGKTVASLHIALVLDAVLNRKHVPCFVSRDLERSLQALSECFVAVLGITEPDTDQTPTRSRKEA